MNEALLESKDRKNQKLEKCYMKKVSLTSNQMNANQNEVPFLSIKLTKENKG